MATKKDGKTFINNYQILKIIGKGGMGQVFLAKHPTLKRNIILKQLKLRDKESKERFLREAKVMLEFRNDNIVQVYDHFKEGTSTYIAMEFVDGKALNEVIQENEMIPVELALFMFYQAALGLFHAHSKKVIHRDIKPHNILISEHGTVKIVDFGIAKSKTIEDKGQALTATGTVVGTPAYMAPEQFSTTQEITQQTDIYALGIVLYEMITGVRPYKNEFSSEVMEAITKGRFRSASKYVKNLPAIARKILSRTFNPNPARRYKSLAPVLKLLRSYFKKYNLYELRESVSRLLRDEDKNFEDFPIYKRSRQIRKNVLAKSFALFSLICISALSFLFVYTNRYYEWIKSGTYGKVIVKFNKANMDPDNIFVGLNGKFEKASFPTKAVPKIIMDADNFDEQKLKKMPEQDAVLFKKYYRRKKSLQEKTSFYELEDKKFRAITKKQKEALTVLINNCYYDTYTKTYYVKKGETVFTIVSGSYKNERKEIILSRNMQKLNKMTKNGKTVKIPIDNLWAQDVNIYFRLWNVFDPSDLLFAFNNYDSHKSKYLNQEEPNLKIFSNNKYIPLKDYIYKRRRNDQIPFYSNTTYHFLVENYTKNGIKYDNKKFSLNLNIDDRTLFEHITLIPTPAPLVITSTTTKLPLILDGKSYGYVYSKGQYEIINYKEIKPKKKGKDSYVYELLLPPADYTLQISPSGKKVDCILSGYKKAAITVSKKDGKYQY